MTADRLEFYRNQLRGVPIADLGRMMWQVLMQATDEAARDEREACAKACESIYDGTTEGENEPWHEAARDCAGAIRARGAA